MTNELGNQCTKWMIDKFQLNSFGSRTLKTFNCVFQQYQFNICTLYPHRPDSNIVIPEINYMNMLKYSNIQQICLKIRTNYNA